MTILLFSFVAWAFVFSLCSFCYWLGRVHGFRKARHLVDELTKP